MRSSRDELSECIRLSQPKREDAKKAKVRNGFLGDIFATFASSRLALRLRRSRSRCSVGNLSLWTEQSRLGSLWVAMLHASRLSPRGEPNENSRLDETACAAGDGK